MIIAMFILINMYIIILYVYKKLIIIITKHLNIYIIYNKKLLFLLFLLFLLLLSI